MKVLMIHVGNEVKKSPSLGSEYYLKRKAFLDGENKYFLKHDIINADNQMQSIRDNGIDVHYGHLSKRKSIFSLFKAGLRIRDICLNENIDIVHALWGSTTGFITTIFSPCPVVISFCGSDLLGTKDDEGNITFGGKINRFLSKTASYMSKHNITKTEQMRSMFPKKIRLRTTVIPNGVDLRAFYPMDTFHAKEKLDFDTSKKHVLFFYTKGETVKNENMAKMVMSIIKDSIPEAELVVATKIPHENLLYYYNASDVMILTSYSEGSNNSIKEAITCNLPVVSVNVGDVWERLLNVKNCYVVKSYDPDLFAQKVIEILESRERSDGVKFSDSVSMPYIAHRLIKVYNNII
jgi:glycosyltransferase involved in cell wall biosynthesis